MCRDHVPRVTPRRVAGLVATLLLAWLAVGSLGNSGDDSWPAAFDDRTLWRMVTDFSEPERRFEPVGGYRSDNLISNERSTQEVLPELRQRRRTGAYIGAGPEQNFTYVVALEPAVAFVVDIRRDNLRLHLLYKALAEASEDRAGFLSRLFGRPRPPEVSASTALFCSLCSARAVGHARPRDYARRRRPAHRRAPLSAHRHRPHRAVRGGHWRPKRRSRRSGGIGSAIAS